MSACLYSRANVRQALESMAAEHGVTMAELVGPTQHAHIVRARRVVARTLAVAPYEMSSVEIGKALGGRHHTTILNLLKTPHPDWQKKLLMVPGPSVKRSIVGDLEARLEQIEKTRAALVARLAQMDALEVEVRETLARLEKVA